MKDLMDVLDCYDTIEAKLYWLDVMVKSGDISIGEAGYTIYKLGILA